MEVFIGGHKVKLESQNSEKKSKYSVNCTDFVLIDSLGRLNSCFLLAKHDFILSMKILLRVHSEVYGLDGHRQKQTSVSRA